MNNMDRFKIIYEPARGQTNTVVRKHSKDGSAIECKHANGQEQQRGRTLLREGEDVSSGDTTCLHARTRVRMRCILRQCGNNVLHVRG